MELVGPLPGTSRDCERILRTLPRWFGIEESLLEYVRDADRFPTFHALEASESVAFLTVRQHFPQSWEVHCIGVLASKRGQGIGAAAAYSCRELASSPGRAGPPSEDARRHTSEHGVRRDARVLCELGLCASRGVPNALGSTPSRASTGQAPGTAKECGLTLRSSADCPRRAGLAAQCLWSMLHRAAKPAHHGQPLSSNVRRQQDAPLALSASSNTRHATRPSAPNCD